jgi:hypothetical protein
MQGYDASSYGDAFADVYDDWYANLGDVESAVDMLVDLARRAPGSGRALELAVGTGRLALPLAARGVEVHGIDASLAMLDRLASKQESGPARGPGCGPVVAYHGDMASDLPEGPFSVVFVAYNSLFNLGGDDQAACVQAVAQRLEAGGAFVVEAFVPDRERPPGATVGVRSMSVDHVVLSIDVHHPEEQRAQGHFVEITETGGVRLRPWSVRYSTVDEIDAFASAAGLSLVQRHEDWGLTPFDEHSPRHVSVYVKPPMM